MLNYIGLKQERAIRASLICLIPMLNYIGLKHRISPVKKSFSLIPMLNYIGLKPVTHLKEFSLFDTYVKLHRSKTIAI